MEEKPTNQPASSGRFGGGGSGRRHTQTASPEPEEVVGTIVKKPNRQEMLRVRLESGAEVSVFLAQTALCSLKQLTVGTRVRVEVSPYNPELGRIIQRIR
jgi:translation initiation factor IF-1